MTPDHARIAARLDELSEYDIRVLRLCNGEEVPEVTGWGSWMKPCLEFLLGRRLIRIAKGYKYVITDAGRAALSKLAEGR